MKRNTERGKRTVPSKMQPVMGSGAVMNNPRENNDGMSRVMKMLLKLKVPAAVFNSLHIKIVIITWVLHYISKIWKQFKEASWFKVGGHNPDTIQFVAPHFGVRDIHFGTKLFASAPLLPSSSPLSSSPSTFSSPPPPPFAAVLFHLSHPPPPTSIGCALLQFVFALILRFRKAVEIFASS